MKTAWKKLIPLARTVCLEFFVMLEPGPARPPTLLAANGPNVGNMLTCCHSRTSGEPHPVPATEDKRAITATAGFQPGFDNSMISMDRNRQVDAINGMGGRRVISPLNGYSVG